MNPTAKSLALRAYGLSEQLWGLQPKRIEADEFLSDLEEHIAAALAEQKEACARVAEGMADTAQSLVSATEIEHVRDQRITEIAQSLAIAAAIRARG